MSEKNDMVYVRTDTKLRQALELYRKQFDTIPNRSEVIRELLIETLTAKGFYK